MGEVTNEVLLEKIINLKEENSSDHKEMKTGILHTNGTVADLVKWKIQANLLFKIFGALIAMVVVPVLVNLISSYIVK